MKAVIDGLFVAALWLVQYPWWGSLILVAIGAVSCFIFRSLWVGGVVAAALLVPLWVGRLLLFFYVKWGPQG